MIFFGHLGLTLAAVRTADKTIINRYPKTIVDTYKKGIDYRFVLLGAILPDLIDKGILFFASGRNFVSGRIFAHSLLFILLLFTLGIVVSIKYKKNWVLVLSFCCLFHQLLDEMWKELNIFFWPVYGSLPPKANKAVEKLSTNNLGTYFNNPVKVLHEINIDNLKGFLSHPYIYISEMVGVVILVYIGIKLFRRKWVKNFLRYGKLD